MIERASLCDYCPLRDSCSDEPSLISARDKAAEVYYENALVELNEVADILTDDMGVNEHDAELAIECLNKVYRDNCSTAEITHIGGGVIGIAARIF